MGRKRICRVLGSGVLHHVVRCGRVTFRESGGTFSVPNTPVSDIYFCRPVAKKRGHEDLPQS